MSTSRSTWKRRERDAASEFGTNRQPGSGSMGRRDQTRSDSVHPRVFIECKLRQSHSAITLWDEVADKANDEHKTPIVCLMEKSRPGRWWLLRSPDIRALVVEWLAAKSEEYVRDVLGSIAKVRSKEE